MSDFGIQIKVDPSGVPASIATVTDALSKAEQKGKATGDAISAGLAKGKSSADAAAAAFGKVGQAIRADALNATGQAFSGLSDHMERAATMLDRIKGPAIAAQNDLVALNEVMQQGAISGTEYVAMLKEINGAQKQSSSSGSGLMGGLIAGASIMGGLMLFRQMTDAVQNAVRSYQDASDHLTVLENRARKFQSAGQDLNSVINDQTLLASKLHAPIETTMELYDRVREASDEYGLSQHELYAITQNLGEATVLSNRSLESAGDVIAKLHTAMESGANPARALRTVFTEYPGVLQSLEEAFHTNEAGIFRLASSHKLSFEQMLVAIGQYGTGVHQMWANQQRTYEDMRKSVDDYAQRFEASGDNQVDAIMKGIGKYHDMKDAADALTASMHPLSDAFRSVGDSVKHNIVEPMTANGVLQTWVGVTSTIAVANGYLIGYTNQYTGSIREATKQMDALKIAYKDGLVPAQDYRQEWEKLETIIEGGKLDAHYRLLMEIRDPLVEYRDMIAALNKLYAEGNIGLYAYQANLERLVASAPKGSSFGERGTKHIEKANGGFGAPQLDVAAPDDMPLPTNKLADEAVAAYRSAATGAEKYGLELEKLKIYQSQLSDPAYARVLQDLHDRFDDAKLPATQFAEAVRDANQKLDAGIYTAQEYAFKIQQISAQYDHSAAQGVKNGLQSIANEVGDTAKNIEDAMKGAFGAVNQTITDMVTKGTASLSQLGDAIEQILVKLALQQAEGSLLSAFGVTAAGAAVGGGRVGFDYMTPSGPGPALPGFATGGDMLVGGAGAPDSKLAMFRVSPGESIHVRTPEQRAAASTASGAGGGTVNHNYFTFDPKALNKSIDSGVQKYIKENRTAVRALLGV